MQCFKVINQDQLDITIQLVFQKYGDTNFSKSRARIKSNLALEILMTLFLKNTCSGRFFQNQGIEEKKRAIV